MLQLLLGNRPFLPALSLPASIDGITSQQILSLMGNADARLHLLERMGSEELRQLLNERAACQSMSCESFFAALQNRVGFKPGQSALQGVMGNIAWAAEQRSMTEAERGFALPPDTESCIYGRPCDSGGPATWNDGTYLERQGARRKAVSKAAAMAAKVKVTMVRERFKK